MDAKDVAKAREKLGELWKIGRPLSRPELGRALGLSPENGGDQVSKIESGKSKISGPIRLILEMYLGIGMARPATPPEHLVIFKMTPISDGSGDPTEDDREKPGMMRIVSEQPTNSVDTVEAARILGLKTTSLRTMRGAGNGPAYVKVAKDGNPTRLAPVFYEIEELERWKNSRKPAE